MKEFIPGVGIRDSTYIREYLTKTFERPQSD